MWSGTDWPDFWTPLNTICTRIMKGELNNFWTIWPSSTSLCFPSDFFLRCSRRRYLSFSIPIDLVQSGSFILHLLLGLWWMTFKRSGIDFVFLRFPLKAFIFFLSLIDLVQSSSFIESLLLEVWECDRLWNRLWIWQSSVVLGGIFLFFLSLIDPAVNVTLSRVGWTKASSGERSCSWLFTNLKWEPRSNRWNRNRKVQP